MQMKSFNKDSIQNNIKKQIKDKLEYDIPVNLLPEIQNLTKTEIKDNIGAGGFSIVKHCIRKDENNNIINYALKIINLKNKKFKKKQENKSKEMVNNEININKLLTHSKIVKLVENYEYNEYIFLLMEYLDKKDLKGFIKSFHNNYKNMQFSEVLCGFFMLQILDGLYYLRNQNILHRDIKPENIMLNSNYDAKIGDFSLSRIINENVPFVTSRSGTLPYLAPENVTKRTSVAGKSAFKADLFSFGVLMYFFLFNTHPFGFRVRIRLLFNIINYIIDILHYFSLV